MDQDETGIGALGLLIRSRLTLGANAPDRRLLEPWLDAHSNQKMWDDDLHGELPFKISTANRTDDTCSRCLYTAASEQWSDV